MGYPVRGLPLKILFETHVESKIKTGILEFDVMHVVRMMTILATSSSMNNAGTMVFRQ